MRTNQMIEYLKSQKEQFEKLNEIRSSGCISDFNDLLEAETDIVAKPFTAFDYYDSAGNWVGNSLDYDAREILKNAYIEVGD